MGSSVYGGVAIGDVDNDGDIDIYNVPYGSTTQNTLRLNDGNANFTLGATIPLDGVAVYYDVVMADFNADGNLDIYQSTRQYNKQNKLWMGNGDGTFTNNDISGDFCLDPNGGCPGGSVTAGDIDNDGDVDLYLTAYYDYSDMNLNHFWVNDGNANFVKKTIPNDYGYTAQDSELVDIDNDGDLDILIAMYYNRQNIIWLNNGSGTFLQDNIVGDLGHSFGLAVGDINNDTELDIYIANGDYGLNDNRLWVQDSTLPTGNITAPTLLSGSTVFDTTISITDNVGILSGAVTIDPSSTVTASNLVCTNTTPLTVDCTIQINVAQPTAADTLVITAQDQADNTINLTQTGYIIDTVAPTITIITDTDI